VARDLHDRLGHTLTAMTVQVTAARRLLATDPEAAGRVLAAVEDLGRRAQSDVDGVVRALRDGAQGNTEVSGGPLDLVGIARATAHGSALAVEFRTPPGLPVDHGCADTAELQVATWPSVAQSEATFRANVVAPRTRNPPAKPNCAEWSLARTWM
jgi:hypothetical protein